jgi:hypothetical protein
LSLLKYNQQTLSLLKENKFLALIAGYGKKRNRGRRPPGFYRAVLIWKNCELLSFWDDCQPLE